MSGVLLLTAIFLLCAKAIRARYANDSIKIEDRTRSMLTVVLGFVMGVLVSFTSVGAGAIGVTTLLLLHPKLPLKRIIGTDIAHAVPLTLIAGVGHWFVGSVQWGVLSPLLIGSLPGIIAGSYLAGRVPDGALRILLAIVMIIVAIKLVV